MGYPPTVLTTALPTQKTKHMPRTVEVVFFCIMGVILFLSGLFGYGIIGTSFYPPCFELFVGSVNCNIDRHMGCVSEKIARSYCDSGFLVSMCTPNAKGNLGACQTYEKCAIISNIFPSHCCLYTQFADCTVSEEVLDVEYSPGVYAFGSHHAYVFWILGMVLLGTITVIPIILTFSMIHPNHRQATMQKLNKLCRW